jgi:hypothetical protein
VKTPAGKISLKLEVKKCRLAQIQLAGTLLKDTPAGEIAKMLLGVRYHPENILAALQDLKLNSDQKRFIERLFFGS